jgi:hypothetical protein
MKKLYILKNKEQNDRMQTFCTFLVELVSAVYGGKKSDDEVGLDDGEGIDELTDEQIEQMKAMLGDDFAKLYPDLI